jgi:hypothetical protein
MGDMINEYKILIGKFGVNSSLAKRRPGWWLMLIDLKDK